MGLKKTTVYNSFLTFTPFSLTIDAGTPTTVQLSGTSYNTTG